MVEINNQRKAFLDMLARSEGSLITDVRKKSWLWRHCRRRAIYWLLRSPSQTCHAKPKTQINRRRTLPASFPVGGMPTASSLAWKTSLRKVRTLWHCSRLRERGAFTYDWSWWYPSGNRPLQQYLGFTAGSSYGCSCCADSLIAKFKEAGGTVRRDWCMSRVTAIISALVICIIVCLSRAVNHYRDNAITYKAQRDKKCQNWSWRTRQLLLRRCVSVMLLRLMQNTRRS